MPVGDEFCPLDKNARRGPERRQGLLGLGDQRLQSRLGRGHAQHAHQGGLAGGGVLAGLLADQRRIAFEIQ